MTKPGSVAVLGRYYRQSVLCLLVSVGRMSGVSELAAEQDTCRRISATAVQVKVLQ